MEGGHKIMKKLLLMCTFILLGLVRNTLTYDYPACIECLPNPQEPQYGGGIIRNPQLDEDLQGWSPFGEAKIEHRESRGNKYIVAHSRNQPNDSVSQKLYLEKDNLYIVSAWLQVNGGGGGDVLVAALFKTENGLKHAGAAIVKSNCWSMLKGGLTVEEASGPADLYFESNNASVEIWVDSVSLQPFTKEQWKSHQYQSMEQTRKGKVQLQAVDEQGKPLANSEINIKQKSTSIPIGCTINPNILTNLAYQSWYLPRFKYATLEDQMKWFVNEPVQGKEDYSAADALIHFAQQHGISVRGHNVHWDNPSLQPSWVHSLSPAQLNEAVSRRQASIMTRYKNKVISWDVVNENVHYSFLESTLGSNASASIYKVAHDLDASAIPFMNDFGTIEDTKDILATPVQYIQRLKDIQSFHGYSGWPVGIGLEGHFTNLDMAYMRASLDMLGALGMPIWLTELDVNSQPNQAQLLDKILREALSHPKVQGIMIWAAWKPEGCYRMCLTDNNFKNLPTGDVVDKILKEMGSNRLRGQTDASGLYEAYLFHGDYEVEITHSSLPNSTIAHHFSVVPSHDLNITKVTLKAHV
ncbi:endo-1,4-beta-xylanase 5-like [Prosopis cineraria]|uniref:endo-1,4-beta-xylanase 5-like n=1 Tax=Prosopis cineraria TaxID=364024 RepID=UPI00240F998E|nr:endo-1,4-beta-xylanase 5-like [Prosopis cineraria]